MPRRVREVIQVMTMRGIKVRVIVHIMRVLNILPTQKGLLDGEQEMPNLKSHRVVAKEEEEEGERKIHHDAN